MKKILVVNSLIPWGGLGNFTLSLVDGLKEKNYEVYGLITHSDRDNFKLFDKKVYENYYVGNLGKIKKYFSVLKYIYKIKPDVIIINYNAVIHFLLPFLPNIKVIDIIHNDVDDFYRISNINSKYIDLWISPTPGIKDGFLKYVKYDENKNKNTKTISHGITSSTNNTSNKPDETFELLFVGAIYEHKGVDLLPDILKKVKDKKENVRLNIVGDGKLIDELKLKFKKLGLDKDVIFHGVIPYEKVRKKMSESHILLFPTRIEAFGLVIAEAMMEGCVPIVTLLEGITDATVINNKTGFLITKNDVNGFVQKVLLLMEDKSLYDKLSLQAKNHAQKYLSLDAMSDSYDKEIKRLLSE
ncbi:glycosyltransferase family 4 protein [Sulfurovum sp. zt1-1]|uniref:Glycosyltransferase family 4 protein n=1 Tax=Sulfurovum zhangzhouensis TaxID=3019067 RepID=A0ABT7R0C1_9BACT|nr:glycosyltransferase family 4 protein [Sulfurovum zhangzhouensis]MDM5272550.1 glycosyltransferase family 4 protein [Sulfurovum zhangzhouensis]